jgi:hypothetical protein
MFYKLLENFIFDDLLINEDLSETFLIMLFKTYKSKNQLDLLSHLLIHLNLKSVSTPAIQKLASDEKLFSIIIYMHSNGFTYEDFFIPINKMFEFYLKENENEFNENNELGDDYRYFNYCEIYGENGFEGVNQLEKSKEYVGHKLLWFIEQSLKGNKLASSSNLELLKFNMSSEHYKYFISLIFYWILQKKIFITFLKFDSYSLFYILNLFLQNQFLIKSYKNLIFLYFLMSVLKV